MDRLDDEDRLCAVSQITLANTAEDPIHGGRFAVVRATRWRLLPMLTEAPAPLPCGLPYLTRYASYPAFD
jgi:hypothetical protein